MQPCCDLFSSDASPNSKINHDPTHDLPLKVLLPPGKQEIFAGSLPKGFVEKLAHRILFSKMTILFTVSKNFIEIQKFRDIKHIRTIFGDVKVFF